MRERNVLRAFGAEHVARMTGLSDRQLIYWDETGLFGPQYASENRRSRHGRIYSFRDAIGLRTMSILRKRHRIPLRQLRKVAQELNRYKDARWSELVLYVLDNEVKFQEPDTRRICGAPNKQYVKLPLQSIIEDVAADANRLRERRTNQIGRVEQHRYVAHNAWVIAGTRIPVRAVRRFSDAGYSPQDIIREYPLLTEADVAAALRHAKKLTKAA